MGKRTSTPNNRPHFAWQEQIAARSDLSPAEKVVLWRLALHRNPNTGRCDPAISTLMKGTGLRERIVQRAIAKAEQLGLLVVTHSKSGFHHDHNHYRFVFADASTGAPGYTPMGAPGYTPTGAPGCGDGCTGVHPNTNLNDQGPTSSAPWEREGGCATPAVGVGLVSSAPLQRKGKKKGKAAAGNGTADPDLQLQVLQHAWLRKAHPLADTNPAAEKEQRRHLDAALKSGVQFDVIAAACKAHAAAYDVEKNDRQFLGPLSGWLKSKGWELPPPDRSGRNQHGKANGHGNGLESGPDGVLRERQGRPQ